MPNLSKNDVVEQWGKINIAVEGRAFVTALWNYCRTQGVFRWKNVFVGDKEVRKIAGFFYEENGFVYTKDRKKVKRYYDLPPMLTPYFFNYYSQECGFIASLMMKFFDVLYPNRRNATMEEILGKRGSRACNNFVSTSKWSRELEMKDFNKDCIAEDEEQDSLDSVDSFVETA
ncbi:unnamed protein product [Orchesella dallaii]|uniref:Uncharacterized protein n=1 Tax=Orchesella dallaii TaxID=48710 RepID=A0ABP1PXW5_9HEXA